MANVKEYSDIISNLKRKVYAPMYLLHGEEPFYIDKISKFIEMHVLEEHERDFNLNIFYGRDLETGPLLETLKRFPMMAERQVVIIREAQDFSQQLADLEAYFKSPTSSTILVIDYKYKKADQRKTWVKALQKNGGVVFYSTKHYDNELPKVVSEFAKLIKYRISAPAAQLMADYLGNDLEKIEGQLKKLTISVPLSQEISEEDVRNNIGISREYSSFDYQNAIMDHDVEKSFRIALELGKNDALAPLPLTLAGLYNQFINVLIYHSLTAKNPDGARNATPAMSNPYLFNKIKTAARHYSGRKAAQIIEKLREIDGKFKGVNAGTIAPAELMKELTFFILSK